MRALRALAAVMVHQEQCKRWDGSRPCRASYSKGAAAEAGREDVSSHRRGRDPVPEVRVDDMQPVIRSRCRNEGPTLAVSLTGPLGPERLAKTACAACAARWTLSLKRHRHTRVEFKNVEPINDGVQKQIVHVGNI